MFVELVTTEYMFDNNAFKNAKKDAHVKLKKIQRIKRTGFPTPPFFIG